MFSAQQVKQNTRTHQLDFTDDEAAEIARIAETEGWQVAAHNYMRSQNHAAYRLAIDEYRGQMRFLLPLSPASRVLQLQCGWGPVALNLASFTKSVVAMDHRPTRLRFVNARRDAATKGLSTVCGGWRDDLPFSSGTFDAVILLDTLDRESSGKELQHRMLSEARRVLKPGGWLLMGVANKLGLPAQPKAAPGAKTYWGYLNLLREAGFRGTRFHAALPSHQEPYFILPLNKPRAMNHFVDNLFTAQDYRAKLEARGLGSAFKIAGGMWRIGRRLGLTGLGRYFVPGYLVMARKVDDYVTATA